MPFKTRISDPRHNAETGCFEAHVTLMEGTESFTYSVTCAAPIDRDAQEVRAALEAQARRQHRPDACRLTRRRLATPLPHRRDDIAARLAASEPRFLDRLLARH